MVNEYNGPPRTCGSQCPGENINDATNANCRICKKVFHLPCYDVIGTASRLFVTKNIVFICDVCSVELDNERSPKRKGQQILQQSVLSPSVTGKVQLPTQLPSNEQLVRGKKASNEQLYALLLEVSGKLDKQTSKMNEIDDKVCAVGIGVAETKKQTNDAYNIVHSRLMLREQQNLRDLAKEVFHTKPNHNAETFGQNKERVYPELNTPKTRVSKPRLYSTILQTKTPVIPQPNMPSERKKEKHITLVDNSSATTVESVKIPTPKQGKKDVQIGRPVEERQAVKRKANPLTKSIWISKFHPETTTDEIENYIIENTDIKDKSKFKCVKLVKKEQDVTTMSFVSFKIDVTPEVFEALIAPENWPQNKHVREFIRMAPPKPTVNAFVNQATETATNSNNENETGEQIETVDLTNTGASGSSNNTTENGNNSSTTSSASKN